MKRFVIYFSLIIAFVFVYSSPSCKEPNGKDGIRFFTGTFEEAVKKAKAEQRPIFIDIYATWCGPCKLLKRKTFADKAVGDFFNANVISMSFDGENGEGVTLAEKYHITGYPTLIFLNKDGAMVNLQTGYLSPEEFLSWAKKFSGK